MKGLSIEALESSRPENPREAIEYALTKLFDDKTKTIDDAVVEGLSFEELIGALLVGRDAID